MDEFQRDDFETEGNDAGSAGRAIQNTSDNGSTASSSSTESFGKRPQSGRVPAGTDVEEMEQETRMCEEHRGHVIEKYCRGHDALACHLCLGKYHRSCTLMDVSEAAEKSKKKKEHKKFQTDLEYTKSKLTKWRKSRQDDQKQLRKDTDDAIAAIKNFRSDIDWALDRLEKKGRDLVEKRRKELNKLIKEDLKLCDEMMAAIEKLDKRIQKAEDRSEAFVDMKKGNAKLLIAQKLTQDMKEGAVRRELVKFSVDPKIRAFALSLGWYGKDRTYLSSEPPLEFPHLYSVLRDNSFDARFRGDRKVCSIEDICVLADGTALLADSANHRLKQLDVTYKTADYLDLRGEPVAICNVDDVRAAVAYTNEATTVIQLVEIENSLRAGNKFQIDGHAVGLSFNDGEFYIADNNRVRAYDQPGSFLRQIYQDQTGLVKQMKINKDGTKIFLVDKLKGVMVLSKDGSTLATANDDSLTDACAVSVDNADQMFVCGHTTHTVIQFGHDQQKLGVVLSRTNGVKCPKSVCFDRRTNRILVSMAGRNVVNVFEMK